MVKSEPTNPTAHSVDLFCGICHLKIHTTHTCTHTYTYIFCVQSNKMLCLNMDGRWKSQMPPPKKKSACLDTTKGKLEKAREV